LSRRRNALRVVVALALVDGGAYVLHPWPRSGADRVRHLIAWPAGCESVTIESVPPGSLISGWRTDQQRQVIQCQVLGPDVVYARFSNSRARDRALRRSAPRGRYCVAGREVIVDGLDGGFPRLCRRLHGDLKRSAVRQRPPGTSAPAT
jgi:hypothetical protein